MHEEIQKSVRFETSSETARRGEAIPMRSLQKAFLGHGLHESAHGNSPGCQKAHMLRVRRSIYDQLSVAQTSEIQTGHVCPDANPTIYRKEKRISYTSDVSDNDV